MAIELKYRGKNDKAGKCFVTVGGLTKETGDGEQARIVALVEIKAFEKTEEDKKELTEAFDELLRKAKDTFSISLWREGVPVEGVEIGGSEPKPDRYKVLIDEEPVYNGDNLKELGIEISNIPEPKFGL